MDEIKTKKVFLNQKRKDYIFAYSFLSIAIIQFVVFYIVVNINSILLAFQEVTFEKGSLVSKFSFAQFERLFRDFANVDSDIRIGLINTIKYFSLNLFVIIPVSLLISYFFSKKILFYKGFRIILFLPSIISGVFFVSMYTVMISKFGPIYTVLKNLFGYEMPVLLNNDRTATPTIMFYVFWTGLASNMILYQGAMNRLPDEILEAGLLDGIGWARELWSIVLPMIWSTFSITVVLALANIFMASGPILLFAEQGGSMGGHKTMTLSFYIFLQTWNGASYEYPAAIGIFFSICTIPIVFGARYFISKLDPEVEY